MATVRVTSWAEFVAAAAVSGDTVELPLAARWDLNKIAPEGIEESIQINCAKITGNGTQILNGRFYHPIQVDGTEVEDLHILNYYSDEAAITGTGVYDRCAMSGLSGRGVGVPLVGASWNRCAFNVETQATGGAWAVAGECRYCRIILHADSASGTDVAARAALKRNCEIVLYMPGTTHLYITNLQNCTIRGNLTSCGYIGKYDYDYSSNTIVNTDDLAAGANVASPLIGVTDAQMKDAAYLASIGFPIGGGDDA